MPFLLMCKFTNFFVYTCNNYNPFNKNIIMFCIQLFFFPRFYCTFAIKTEKMKKTLIIITAALALTACQESLEDRAARELHDYTAKNCPTPVVDDMNVDSATFEPQTRTIRYYFKLFGKSDNAVVVKKVSKKIREKILEQLKSNTKLKAYKDDGFNFRYTYRSASKPTETLFDVNFTQKDYK